MGRKTTLITFSRMSPGWGAEWASSETEKKGQEICNLCPNPQEGGVAEA